MLWQISFQFLSTKSAHQYRKEPQKDVFNSEK